MSSKLRPETHDSTAPALPDNTAYYAIYGAVLAQTGLCHGRLDDGRGAHCAIGSLWATTNKGGITLHASLIDEVAAVNDSVPHLSKRQRKAHVLRWLRWKLDAIGMLGIRGKRAAERQKASA